MSREHPTNLPASVRARLLHLATRDKLDFDALLVRYGVERLLYRLACSPHVDRFVLKGAALFTAWGAEPHRVTRDIDLLGFGLNTTAELERVFREVVSMPVPPDGLAFDPGSIRGQPITKGAAYLGVRVTGLALLDRSRIRLQVDVGFGDAVVPPPVAGMFPSLLDFPAPDLQLYPPEVVVAEKFNAMVTLGMTNTRLKDYYDLWYMAHTFDFDGARLRQAIAASFAQRRTPLPVGLPMAMSMAFAEAPEKQSQWRAFQRKARVRHQDLELPALMPILEAFLMPPSLADDFDGTWSPGGPWRP